MLLIRHGESQPARAGVRFPATADGHADPPLDPHGEDEARLVADRLAGEEIDAIYVTSLRRTQQTAAALARRLALEPRVEADLREVHLGDWEGGAFRINVSQRHPLAERLFAEQRWDVIPNAESMESLQKRVRAGVMRIAEAHRDRRVAVFTHGGVIGTIVAMATDGRTFAFIGADNASITHIVVDGDSWILRRFNDTGHLGTDLDRPSDPLT